VQSHGLEGAQGGVGLEELRSGGVSRDRTIRFGTGSFAPCLQGIDHQAPKVLRLRQRVEQRLGVLEVGGIEPLGEPAVHRGEEVVGLDPLALLRP
jgi:hypothetical protein